MNDHPSRWDSLESEITLQFARSGGAGGQNVNKVSTKVRLSFDLRHSRFFSEQEKIWIEAALAASSYFDPVTGIITLISQEHRTQLRNREVALIKLVQLLKDALKPKKKRKKTRKPRSAERKRLDSKKKQSEKKSSRTKGSFE